MKNKINIPFQIRKETRKLVKEESTIIDKRFQNALVDLIVNCSLCFLEKYHIEYTTQRLEETINERK